MSGPAFLDYVEQMVAPAIRPGDVVVMDNLGAHKLARVDDAIRTTGASLLDLPAYSFELKSIEQVFAKLKVSLLRATARTRGISGPPSANLPASSPQPNVATTSRNSDTNSLEMRLLRKAYFICR